MDNQIADFVQASVARELGLQPEEVGKNTDFEELGMTSLNTVLISGLIEDEYAIEIEPSMLFEHRSVESVAAAIEPLVIAKQN